jgi:hypothetical protein
MKRHPDTLSIQVQIVENGWIVTLANGRWGNGAEAELHVFNDIDELNEFLAEKTNEL